MDGGLADDGKLVGASSPALPSGAANAPRDGAPACMPHGHRRRFPSVCGASAMTSTGGRGIHQLDNTPDVYDAPRPRQYTAPGGGGAGGVQARERVRGAGGEPTTRGGDRRCSRFRPRAGGQAWSRSLEVKGRSARVHHVQGAWQRQGGRGHYRVAGARSGGTGTGTGQAVAQPGAPALGQPVATCPFHRPAGLDFNPSITVCD